MKRSKTPWFWLVLLLAGTAILVLWLNNRFPGSLSSQDSQIDMVRSLLILCLVAGSLTLHRRVGLNHVLRNITLWTAIAGVVFLGYSFRHEAGNIGNRLLSELVPTTGSSQAESIKFAKSANGHFLVELTIDGTAVRFLVDTGASDIVLSPADASRLGFDVASLTYSTIYNTANGQVHGAPVELGTIELGPIHLENMRASVNGAPMNRSLLGMRFLNRLSGYEVSGDYLVFYP